MAWGHGPSNGKSLILEKRKINFEARNILPGQYVAVRILFDNENIVNSLKESRIDAKEMILADEIKIRENSDKKEEFTKCIIFFSVCLLIYWIVLLLIFEKEKKYQPMIIEEEQLLKKYNPLIAGCIQGSRDILARDVIAVILNLIDKGIIKLDIKPKPISEKETYTYLVSKNPDLEGEMDEIEKIIYNWIFDEESTEYLEERLKQIPKEDEASENFSKLDKLAKSELSKLRANEAKVPMYIRVFNTILFVICLLLACKHIIYNGFNVYNPTSQRQLILILILVGIGVFPALLGLMIIPINLIIIIKQTINKVLNRITGQRIVTTTVCLIIIFGTIIALTFFLLPYKYLVVDEILICISTIILLTDNLMLQNNPSMLEDYNRLNFLKNKIKNYSLMEDRDIEHVVLWGKYLAFAVSFGIADKLLNRIRGLHLEDNLINISYKIEKIITSDYYDLYRYGGLEARFMKGYKELTKSMMSSSGDGSSSHSSGSISGGFSGGGGYSGGGRKRWRRRSLLKIYL